MDRSRMPRVPSSGSPPGSRPPDSQFGDLTAASLYCPTCRQATPVRERLLLVLTDGQLFDYRCAVCGTSTGTRTARQRDPGVAGPGVVG